MRSILDGVTLEATHRAESYDPAVKVEGDCGVEKRGTCYCRRVLVEMHMTDWAETRREDPSLNTMLHWSEA